MNKKMFEKVRDHQLELCRQLLTTKGREYSPSELDRLHNFKQAAHIQQITPMKALGGMMAKHTVSIYDMIDADCDDSLDLWTEKITDHINYLILLKALATEQCNKRYGN